MQKTEKLIIVGSGPAGLAAAIYVGRGNLSPLCIEGRSAGGQLMLTTDVDDFPGFPDGIKGPDLMAKMRAQAERFGTKFLEEDVVSVDFTKKPFVIKTESSSLLAESVIIATGASAQWLGLSSEQKFIGRGVSSCAVCDGPFFKDKKVIVVGGGDTAMREAQHISKFASEVTVVHRRDTLRAQASLLELVKSKQNVKFLLNSTIEEVLGEDKVTGVKLKNTQSGEFSQMEVDGIFVAIGHKPNTEFLQGQVELNDKGYIVIHNETKTSVPGIFVAGGVADYCYRQAVTAAGAGCKAALDAEEYLEKIKLPTNGN